MGKYLKPGTPCRVWEPGARNKQLWYYAQHIQGYPVFYSAWPFIYGETCNWSLSWLQYDPIGEPEELPVPKFMGV